MTKNFLYQAPAVEFLDMEHEGVLCQSEAGGMATIEDWTQNSGAIDF